jgi:hypothetical protein
MSKSLDEWRQEYFGATTKASDICRNLALAGIAIIWIFKNTETSVPIIPKELVTALFLLVTCLTLDLSQYFIKGIIWYNFFSKKEEEVEAGTAIENDIKANPNLPRIIHVIYYVKFFPLVWAYFAIGSFLLSKM